MDNFPFKDIRKGAKTNGCRQEEKGGINGSPHRTFQKKGDQCGFIAGIAGQTALSSSF